MNYGRDDKYYDSHRSHAIYSFFFFQAEDGIRDKLVTGVQTCALPIYTRISLPEDFPHSWRSGLSGQTLESNGESDEPSLGVSEILNVFPIALLKPEKV